jgi:hypothetical protein
MTMFPTFIFFPSSDDKENIPVTRSEKRSRHNALIDGQSAPHPTATLRALLMSRSNTTGMKGSRRPLLQRVISRGQILTNRARTPAHSVPHEKVTRSPLSPICQPPSLSPVSPCPPSILNNPPRAGLLPSIINTHLSSPSVRQSRSPLHITIISDPKREKREAHPLSSSVLRSRLSSHTTILNNPEKEKREAHPRSNQRTKSIWNALAAALALKRAPAISVPAISILNAPTPPPQIPASTPVTAPDPDAIKGNTGVELVLNVILDQETDQGVCDSEITKGTDTTMASSGELLSVPLVDWRGRLDEDELIKYYPKEHAQEQFVQRLRSMVRSGNRQAAARRRDQARQRRQAATTAPATTTSSIILIVSPTCP